MKRLFNKTIRHFIPLLRRFIFRLFEAALLKIQKDIIVSEIKNIFKYLANQNINNIFAKVNVAEFISEKTNMKLSNKKYNSVIMAMIFVIACLFSGENDVKNAITYDMNLNSGAVLSFLKAKTSSVTVDEQNNKTGNIFNFAVMSSRLTVFDENYIIPFSHNILDGGYGAKKVFSYIQNKFSIIILHPPLEKLAVLLI